jgi:hypothetical protein
MKTKPAPGQFAALILMGFLAAGSAPAAEKAPDASTSEKISSKPPEAAVDLRRFNRSMDSLSPSFFNEGLGNVPFIPPPAPPGPAVPNNRALELRDTKKNWIFATPSDMYRTKTIEEAMGVKDYGPDGKEKKPHSVVGAFLENKPRSDSETTRDARSFDARENSSSPSFRYNDSRDDPSDSRGGDAASLKERRSDFERAGSDFRQKDDTADSFNFALGSPIEQRKDTFFTDRSESLRFDSDLRWDRTGNTPGELELRGQQQTRLAEFNTLYGARPALESRSILNTASPFNDPLRPASAPASATPDTFSRTPGLGVPEMNRFQPPAAGSALTRPTLIEDRGPGSVQLPTISSPSQFPLHQERRIVTPQPSVLEFPRRPF